MMSEETLHQYAKAIKKLKKECLDAGLSEQEFKQIYFESLKGTEIVKQPVQKRKVCFNILCLFITLLCLFAIYNYKTIHSCIVCNLQEYIYPGLRLWRQISIPLISLFPSLTELHQETCLIQNPYFTVVDMDCWPCSSVQNVREIQDPNPSYTQHIAPLVYLTKQTQMTLDDIHEMYLRNKNIFDEESPKILVNNKYFLRAEDVFVNKSQAQRDDNLYIWKINSLNAARVLRQFIPRPKIVPKFGQSSERYIIIDTNGNQFQIPDTECNYSFLLILNGNRNVKLKPADECKHQCKSLEVNLPKSYLLWYNWWYWRPVVQQTVHNETLIAHAGSYC